MPIPASARDADRSGPAAITPGAGRWDRASAGECARLHAAACSILGRTGVRVDHRVARRLLAAAGASVDVSDRVRIPADRVDAILAGRTVPPPLPEAASAELREIVARAEARAGL